MTTVRRFINALFPIGTQTLLWGVHCWFIHPFMVARAWRKLFGPARGFPLWVAFFVHDWGYWGCWDLDGEQGKLHPERGAEIMRWMFGSEWGRFCLLHSRSLARQLGAEPSNLAAADKLATSFYPCWLYLFLGGLSGETEEYRLDHADTSNPYGLDPTCPLVIWAKQIAEARQQGRRVWERFLWRKWFEALCDDMGAWADRWLEERRRADDERLRPYGEALARAARAGLTVIVVEPTGTREVKVIPCEEEVVHLFGSDEEPRRHNP